MNPTDYIIKKTNMEAYEEGGLSAFNDGGVECEVGEFLYSLVRLVKPEYVIETGTHKGISASYIGLGLKSNKKGNLETIEFDRQHWEESEKLWKQLGIEKYVYLHKIKVEDYLTQQDEDVMYDIVLLDTEPDQRFGELLEFYPYTQPGGFIIIHDLHRHMSQIPHEELPFAWPYGKLPEKIKNWVKDGELRPFHISTERGLTVFYKTKAEDHKWI